MGIEELPLILSPNLGCPIIISMDEVRQKTAINIILAGQYGEFIHISKSMFKNSFKLVPSYPEMDDSQKEITLEIIGDIEEITGWNRLFDFSNTNDTQFLLNSEVHYNVLGEKTKYWLIRAIPSDTENLLKKSETGKQLPTLYDLIFTERPDFLKINYHAVQFVETFKNSLNFIHLTDLHISQRNDEILDEVLKVERNEEKNGKIKILLSKIFSRTKKEEIRGREQIKKSYINFNDNFRRIEHIANEMAKRGELDFIVITGDIVDFIGLGWDEEINQAENNWKIFLDMVTGQGNEKDKGFLLRKDDKTDIFNKGLNIAIFTSTGNHDWRLHPGSLLPYTGGDGECIKFGLKEEEARNYNYKSFDSSEYPLDKRKQLSDALVSQSLKRLNLDAFDDKKSINIFKFLENKWLTYVVPLGGGVIGGKLFSIVGVIFGLAAPTILSWVAKQKLKKYADLLADNPIHAEVKALHYYFKHINPYFDYAFSFGNNHFILMDTGADVVTIGAKELLDGKETKHLKKASFQDNILGMSPDSMAFDDRQAFYNWSQIVWLDKVLSCISNSLFDFNEVPGNDTARFIEFLNKKFYVTWLTSAKIEKTDDNLIRATAQDESLSFQLVNEKTRAILTINNKKFDDFIVKNEEGKLNVFTKDENDKIFICVHAPPLNYDTKYKNKLNTLRESLHENNSEKFIEEEMDQDLIMGIINSISQRLGLKSKNDKSLNLTYGTINHYLSQFFFLCRGLRENPHRKINPAQNSDLKKVDMVLSGHAHIDVEFRIDIDRKDPNESKVRIFHDKYSDNYAKDFYDSKTFIVQTAACGPPGNDAESPPYWRMIKVDKQNRITSFEHKNLESQGNPVTAITKKIKGDITLPPE